MTTAARGAKGNRPRAIAVAQTRPVAGDVAANLEEHVRLSRLAAAGGAQVVLFPELSLTGYELGLATALAFTEDDPRLSPLVDFARSTGTTLIVGAPSRCGTRLHVSAFILAPDGSTVAYTKRRLGAFSAAAGVDGSVPPGEGTVFDRGDRDPPVHFSGHLAALAICADVGDPEHPRWAAGRGAGTYLASMFVIPSELDRDVERLRSVAVEHEMIVAMANFGGPSGGLAAAGRSAVWAQNGEVVVRLDPQGSGVAVATETGRGWRATCVMLDGGRE